VALSEPPSSSLHFVSATYSAQAFIAPFAHYNDYDTALVPPSWTTLMHMKELIRNVGVETPRACDICVQEG
jgi:hypothetical protein